MVSGEHKLIHKNGNERWVELSMSTRFTEIGELDAIIAVIYDITEQHYLHNQLVQTQKMETIGTMAGG
ncbi:MAG TPA: PAS domain S-box protein, partial [Desulfobulbaceae bacterium]|nr:PAS domain S-box protein [Desulfobulbaceae bacterium]